MTLLDTPTVNESQPDADVGFDEIEPEDMHLYDDGRAIYELVDGRMVEKHMSDTAHFTANGINVELIKWILSGGAGQTFVESGFQCFSDRPKLVRKPDVAFVSKIKLDGYALGHAHIRLVPDLVIEVNSPGDALDDVFEKVREYHAAGVPMVWVAVPLSLRVLVEPNPSGGGRPFTLTADDELTGGDVLPGFSCRVADLFPSVKAKL